jgi:signal transduction histidine kinase
MARSDPQQPQPSAAERITRDKERILALWEDRVRREIFAARRESHPIIIDTIPLLLDDLAEALGDPHRRNLANEGATACQEHGGERARMTEWNIEDLIHEYQLLREVIFETLLATGPLTDEEQRRIRTSIDEVMKESAVAFGLVQKAIREQFFATLTHDLRGPLAAATTAAHLILKYDDRANEHPKLAARIVRNLARVEKMITDLLDAARVRAGQRLSLRIEECRLDLVAREVIEEFGIARGIAIHLDAPPTSGFWDAAAFTRVFENLLGNAIKYGDPSKAITVTIEQAHGRTIVRVHNEGNPIPVEEQETLFAAYRRSDRSHQSGEKGWGLGLALVRGVAEAHGGSVMVDSSEERGTTFGVDVPTDARQYHEIAKQPFA